MLPSTVPRSALALKIAADLYIRVRGALTSNPAGCMHAQLDVRVHQLLGTCALCHLEIRGHGQVDTNVRLTTLPGASLTNRVQRRAQEF